MFHYQPCISYAPQQPLNQQEMLDTMEAIFETGEALNEVLESAVASGHLGYYDSNDGIPF